MSLIYSYGSSFLSRRPRKGRIFTYILFPFRRYPINSVLGVLLGGRELGLKEEGRGVVGRIIGDIVLLIGLSKVPPVNGKGLIGEDIMLF